MARRRLAVVLSVPQPLAAEIDGIRRACGDPQLGRIGPHITLVPPVNVAEQDVDEVLQLCRRVAAATSVLRLALGAPSTFAPVTPLAWLTVAGDVDALVDLRRRLDVGPLSRPPEHPFVPHVTISGVVDPHRLDAMLTALADFAADLTIDRLHVLENRQLPNGRWGWLLFADAPCARPAVIGTGGMPLALSVSTVVDPDGDALLATGGDTAAGTLAVTARRDDEVLGVAVGSTRHGIAVLDGLVVADGHRRQGIGSHLLARFTTEAIDRACVVASHTGRPGDPLVALCKERGWTEPARSGTDGSAGTVTVTRVLGAPS